MKKILYLFLIVSVCNVYAQDGYKKLTITADIATSLVGNLMNVELIDNGVSSVDFSASKVFQFGFDYRVSRFWSVGGAYAFQNLHVVVKDYSYTDDYGVTENVDLNFGVTRSNIAVRFLLQYLPEGRTEIFSGFRVGYTNWGTNLSVKYQDVFEQEAFHFKLGGKPSFQLILVGVRTDLNSWFGLHGEFAVGAPYYLSAGVHFRI